MNWKISPTPPRSNASAPSAWAATQRIDGKNTQESYMIKAVTLLILVTVAAVLALAARRPDRFRIQRSLLVRAPADRIYPLISNLRRFNDWNPYAKKDPSMKTEYSGPESGPGAAFHFDGSKEVGKGSISIVDAAAPAKLTMALDMTAPFSCHNLIEFSLRPSGTGTEVTWAMQGESSFIAKVMGLFCNMDKMVGRDFEAGLADLKAQAERN
jgi:hypothetical protein